MPPGERSSTALPPAGEASGEQPEAARALARIRQLIRTFRMPRAMEDEPAHHGRAAAADAIRRKEVSSLELTEACLARTLRLEPELNAFISLDPEDALEQARNADAALRRAGGHAFEASGYSDLAPA